MSVIGNADHMVVVIPVFIVVIVKCIIATRILAIRARIMVAIFAGGILAEKRIVTMETKTQHTTVILIPLSVYEVTGGVSFVQRSVKIKLRPHGSVPVNDKPPHTPFLISPIAVNGIPTMEGHCAILVSCCPPQTENKTLPH